MCELFAPIIETADSCWWFLGGYGIQLPAPPNAEDPSVVLKHMESQSREYANWLNDDFGYRVGKPGWFSRYANYADTNWAMYFGCNNATEIPTQTLDWLENFTSNGTDWFGDAAQWGLPTDVAFVCRNIDDALWHVFTRDPQHHMAVQQHLTLQSITFRPFVETAG
ncbi:hypothetical protein Poly24_36320 [Rosistilla carotiformis]|uniref:Uncharacterized protein n=2 Tax=Rosistilla carotiformis TaxID=2528017 RepID=A0A518JWK0_9BACT|nr:hypothetical protein Poly24_36320 [Rosistilla carotiformis]